MIPPAMVERCGTLDGVEELLRGLGYEVDRKTFSPARWRGAGVPVPPFKARVASLVREAPLMIWGVEGEDAGSVIKFHQVISSWNIETINVTIHVDGSRRRVAFIGSDSRRRPRRIDVDLQNPRRDSLDRIETLQRSGRPAERLRLDLHRAFERESVGRSFFTAFRDHYHAIAAELRREFPGETPRRCEEESLVILSRVLFLYFLQQKRWLDDNPGFMRDLVQRSVSMREGIFSGLLLPLFFGCLNTPVANRDPFATRMGRIPYLNGGLFEPTPFESEHSPIRLDDAHLESVLSGTFERFQFSIEEDDEAGAHIDPEMLGHVFESLMAEEDRLESGSFYTPRSIVDEQVRSAAAAWLCEGSEELEEASERLFRGDARGFRNRRRALERLSALRIVDPACGSGAFLLSALQTLDRAARDLGDSDSSESRRRRIVARNLYGIDLKPEAVRLCELRLWLAIVAASENDGSGVEPLPNLDRNIVQGNALLGPSDYLGHARFDLYREWSFALKARQGLVDHYRSSTPSDRPSAARALRSSDLSLASAFIERALSMEKGELETLAGETALFPGALPSRPARRKDIEARIAELEDERMSIARGEVGWLSADVHFAHIAADGGFDLVIGNPPWVRASRIEPSLRRRYADRYPAFAPHRQGGGIPQGDLFVAFFEKAMRLVAPGGIVALLVPSKLCTAAYGARLRETLCRSWQIVSIRDWTDAGGKAFDADTFPLMIVTRRTGASRPVQVSDASGRFTIAQKFLSPAPGGPWMIVREPVRDLIRSLHERGEELGLRFGPPAMGVKSGANRLFFVRDEAVDHERGFAIVDRVRVPISGLVRLVRGRDVKRWRADDSTWMLWPRVGESWVASLENARGLPPGTLQLDTAVRIGSLPMVVWKDVSRRMTAAVVRASRRIGSSTVPIVPNQTTYWLRAGSERSAWAIAATLNSTIGAALLVASADPAKDRHYRYFGRMVSAFPLPPLDPDSEGRLAGIAKAAAATERPELASAIDDLLAELWGLRSSELETLRNFLESRIERRS
ncbi:MAG TPA: DNA methyltransferase [Thermoanaerobaculia bacterium]|nr:DNA methyltransferase [Thermoanaerobaculia bacterium]